MEEASVSSLEEQKNESVLYTKILQALLELPFQVGKQLLIDFLRGSYKNKSISKNQLDELHLFGCLEWNEEKIISEIDRLVQNGMIELAISDYNKFVKVLKLTIKGNNEIAHPTLLQKQLKNNVDFKKSEITEEERIIFQELDSFLNGYNEYQKKAIVSIAQNILCVAGAGSGKTTVLTKRIEFLVRYKAVAPGSVLAITFTRKAKKEMEKRLQSAGIRNVNVHTFNSFCEKILRSHEMQVYGRTMRVQNYSDKILAMNMALGTLGIDMGDAIDRYFTPQQRRFKTAGQLSNTFMNDCFSVMDYFKVSGIEEFDFSEGVDPKNRSNAQMIYKITKYLKEHMQIQGLRDYSDQLIDCLDFLKKNQANIPKFQYVLIDEYQDVNAMQVELITLLNAPNLFAVGDPRQSIFGWRGSDIRYILNFQKDYGSSEVIHLTKNYRSKKMIVDFMNHSISGMGLPNLEHHFDSDSSIKIVDFENEQFERIFIVDQISNSKIPYKDIFVLGRTNRQLTELSQMLNQRKIPHVLKTDEVRNPKESPDGALTLATIHAIKGLEAKKVFVIGCNEQNFPCKASDHPAVEMVKTEHFDKLEEERRLFYVAISRAQDILCLTYSGKKPTYFITDEMRALERQSAPIKEIEEKLTPTKPGSYEKPQESISVSSLVEESIEEY
ncbi:UvrD-helicase domain-containing protein [archaeon]|jgi:superfamily I DNA/RNA helicase|nr:UvrD-helicase domain-containing protein [archaeon]MBT6606545.1 UvrD-helicase domain-containing protein [archaeon]MBT7251828.1 UvrD-helicase domain-containing protein [archaeon]